MSALPVSVTDPGEPTQATGEGPAAPGLRSGLDGALLGAAVLLAGFGLVMIVSASAPLAERMGQSPFAFGLRQTLGLGLGAAAGLAVLLAPWKVVRRAGVPFYVLTLLAMFLVHSPIGVEVNGAPRWIDLGPLNLQPSELAKLALALVLADVLGRNEGHMHDLVGVVLVPSLLFVAPMLCGSILQTDLGATVLLFGVATVAFFVAGLPWRWLGALGALGLGGVALAVLVEPFRMQRLVSFLDPYQDAEGSGYQVVQGWVAMAVGGPFGRGLGEGVAQQGFLPEAHTDMISAVIVEELGLVGWMAVFVLLGVILVRGTRAALRARSLHDIVLGSCLVAVLGAQAVINTGVIVGWMPPKGLVLPLLSYGATAAIVHVVMVALLLRIGIESAPDGPAGEA